MGETPRPPQRPIAEDGPRESTEPRVTDVAALMRHASMSSTYKPALLKALLRCVRLGDRSEISLEAIGREFTRLYWNQTVVYHLRQAASLSKEASAVKLIREAARTHGVRDLDLLPRDARAALDKKMAKLLQVNVLEAFHATKPETMPRLYEWVPGSAAITVGPDIRAFMRANEAPLELIGNYYWALFLENTNRLAPRIVQKVQRNALDRQSLQRYLTILKQDSDGRCFYCKRSFDAAVRVTVDHVIPWSFLLEDPLWDLVLACAQCNGSKSDWLPAEASLRALLERNRKRREDLRRHVSFLISDDEVERLYHAAISVEWPRFWSPA
jgi:5-methylcytosine-specific restriction endonuclease McrA